MQITGIARQGEGNGTYPDLLAAVEVDEDVVESGWPLVVKEAV
jgi:hypothetical protein